MFNQNKLASAYQPGTDPGRSKKIGVIALVLVAFVAVGVVTMLFGKTSLFKGSLLEATQFAENTLRDYGTLVLDFENNVTDKSTMRNGPVLTSGDPEFFEEGYLGKAIRFDGENDYLRIDDDAQAGLDPLGSDFTVMGWIKTEHDVSAIVSKGERGGQFYLINILGGTVAVDFSDGIGAPISLSPVGATRVNNNIWHHFTVSFDRDRNLSIFVDGVLTANADISSKQGVIDNARPFTLGAELANEDRILTAYVGLLDEFKMLNGIALNQEQVNKFYQVDHAMHWSGIEENDPVLFLNFNEFVDLSGNGNEVVNHAAEIKEFGLGGKSAKFNGMEYVEVSTLEPAILPDGNGTITALYQYNTDAPWGGPVAPSTRTIFAYGGNPQADGAKGLRVGTKTGSNTLSFYYDGGQCDSDVTVIDDSQHQIALTKNGNVLTMYVDAEMVCQKNDVYLDELYNYLLIGADLDALRAENRDAEKHYMNGWIDEFKAYNRALSEAELTQAYAPYSPDVLGDGDMLYLNFDGEEVIDLGPFSHGLDMEHVSMVDDGIGAGALKFDGKSSFIKIADHDSLDPLKDDFTVSYWAKLPSALPGPVVFSKGKFIGPLMKNNLMWAINYTPTTINYAQMTGEAAENADSSQSIYSSADENKFICDNKWHNYAVVGDRDGSLKIYLDGILIHEDVNFANLGDTNFNSKEDLLIGKLISLSGGEDAPPEEIYFNGLLDEFRIRRSAVSANTLKQEFDAGKAELQERGFLNRSVLSFNFNENTPLRTTDRSGFGHHGELRDATWTQDGINGGAYSLLSLAGESYIISSESWDLQVKNTVTLEALMKFADERYSGGKLIDIASVEGENDFEERMILKSDNRGRLSLSVDQGDEDPFVSRIENVISPNVWHHVVASYDARGTIKLYVDGLLVQEQPSAQAKPIFMNHNRAIVAVGPFNGTIDEVNLYDYALSAQEITDRYNRFKPLIPVNLLSGNWSSYARGIVSNVADPDDADNQVLKVQSNGGDNGAQQYNIPVTAGYSYKLTAKYKRLGNASCGIWVGFKTSDEDIDLNPYWDYQSVGFTNYEREIVVTENGTLSVVLAARGGEVLFDDISLVVSGPVSDEAIRRANAVRVGRGAADPSVATEIRDGNMEAEIVSEWKFVGGAPLTILSKEVENGNRILRVGGSGAGINQSNLDFDPQFKYVFSFKHKGVSGRTTAYVAQNGSGLSNAIQETLTEISGRTDWRTYTKPFVIPGNDEDPRLSVVFNLNDGGEAYLDDVAITKVGCKDEERYFFGNDGTCHYIPQGCPVSTIHTLNTITDNLTRTNYNISVAQYNVLKDAYKNDCPDLFELVKLPSLDSLPVPPSVVDNSGNAVKPTVMHFVLIPEFDPSQGATFLSITIDQAVNHYLVKIIKQDGGVHVLKEVSTRMDSGLYTEVWNGFFEVNGERVKAPKGIYPYIIDVENENGRTSVTGSIKIAYEDKKPDTAVKPGENKGSGFVSPLKVQRSCDAYFNDMSVSDPDCNSFAWLYENGIMLGSDDSMSGLSLFKPEQYLRRAEFVAISNRLAGFTDDDYNASADGNLGFWDIGVPDDSTFWIFRELKKATKSRGVLYPPVIQGYKDGSFRPNNQITNAELWKVIVESLRSGQKANFNLQADTKQVPWFRDYFRFFADKSLVSSRTDPMRSVTRREAARLLYSMAFEKLY